MKVLNLRCEHDHAFEGWFASEADFLDQVTRGVVPFMIAQFAIMFLMVAFPQLVMVPARWFY